MKRQRQKKVGILIENGFDECGLLGMKHAFEDSGMAVVMISYHNKNARGWNEGNWSDWWPVDVEACEALSVRYAALLVPGGIMHADKLRENPYYIDLVKEFLAEDKPLGLVAHAVHLLMETHRIEGRYLTSPRSIKTDLIYAGAHWEEAEVVQDRSLVTTSSSKHIHPFTNRMIKQVQNSLSLKEERT